MDELIERSATKAPSDALVDTLDGYRPRLLAIARSLRAAEPEDLVQTTFEVAMRNIGRLQRAEALWPWLATIETREAFRLRRRFRPAISFGPAHEPRQADAVDSAELRDALSRLPTRVRAAVVLHYMADLSVADTAAALGVSENTVKSQLKTGLRKLKESMS